MTIAATERPGVATPSEKLEARLTRWSSPSGLTFNNEAARAAYQQRVQLFKDIIRLRKPERVPICPNVGFFVMAYAGITSEEAMYDYEKLGQAVRKFNTDFECDTITSSIIYGPGKLFELLDYKLYRWPGHGVPATTSYQCQESTYMRGDEYDTLIADPSSYFLHHYLPRIFGEFAPWLSMPAFTDIVELPMVGGAFVPFGLPEMQRTLTKLQEAGTAALEWINACTEIDNEIAGRQGLPSWIGGFSKAPFDTLGDTMRGTRGIMVDKFQRPDKILEAMERLVPLA
ncbi:MAG: uroporphyrinogen decarboxylase, partial [Chloroflexota bacterium]|nr:uroporphyrinogen decarboxylase [Chloroflexota bacterium]